MSEEVKEVKGSDGKAVDSSYLQLVTLMIKWDVRLLQVSYSGGGDDGTIESPIILDDKHKVVEKHKLLLKKNHKDFELIDQLCANIIDVIVSPDFNDDGSSGTALFELNSDNQLVFTCDHSEFYTTSNDTNYERTLIEDTSLL